MKRLFFLFLVLPFLAIAQKKQITLDDIFKNETFRGEVVRGFQGEKIEDFVNPASVKDENGNTLSLDDYQLSADKKKLLVFKDRESIYRRSSKAIVYVHDIASGKTTKLDNEKILHATFSPDGSKIAYVKNNNLFVYDMASGTSKAITTDGKWNNIINGNCDWVYEEEFEFTRAFDWSPKGDYLAYYRFDESNVKEYTITKYNDSYNEQYSYKYPKAGEANSVIEIHVYNMNTGQDIKVQFDQGDIYIPRIKWTQDDNTLCVFWMNRHQNDLKLLLTNAATGTSNLLYEEKNKYFVDINDNWRFLKDGKGFLFTSEMNGSNQVYLYSMDGKTKTQLTKGNSDVTEINAVDEKNKLVYYTTAYPTPMDRSFFVTDFAGKKTTNLTVERGWHRVEMNNDFTQFFDYYSTINTPQTVNLYSIQKNKKGLSAKFVRNTGDNAALRAKMEGYDLAKAEFIRVPNSKGDTLNGWMLKPSNFDAGKKYPVLFCNYGGPGSQQVVNRFGAASFWHQMLAEKGYIIVSIDNTGTGNRGEEFKKKTYLQLGKYEIEDQIDAAKYIADMPFVDRQNIGHWGWSFGGFMSSLAITKGSDIFSAAIAVAPVTSWRFYDNIYTERYMRTPQENPKGYDDNSPINFTKLIKGKFLIIHGTGDDNVHFQNSVEMVESMIQNNIQFESAYYPNKTHGIFGGNTTYHLWSRMTNWILKNIPANPNKEKAAF